ncbi:hypothetical protein JOF56_000593 [Kibdelosporangium banguiense]|uniref:Transposase n=1 Tax=Kibdelosporangium banguiense TaxID=1365924 RepID=A0ABS4T739_9PSEU|nr:hypothetical protein [Kibdelosporangium banguiense]
MADWAASEKDARWPERLVLNYRFRLPERRTGHDTGRMTE